MLLSGKRVMGSPQLEYNEKSLLGERKANQKSSWWGTPSLFFFAFSLLGDSPLFPTWKEAEGSFCWSLAPFALLLFPHPIDLFPVQQMPVR